MTILPVLDLLDGIAVHAVGGVRNEYQPLRSMGCQTSCPLEITSYIKQNYGLADWYIADLDGIVHRKWNLDLLDEITANGCRPRIDFGIQDVDDVLSLGLGGSDVSFILASETLQDCSVLDSMACMINPARMTFSLDLIEGEFNCPAGAWGDATLPEVVEYVSQRGIADFLVLDLAFVGCERDLGTLDLCLNLRKQFPSINLMTGGGVRKLEQLQRLEAAGVDNVLVGSGIHQGTLTVDELARYRSDVQDSKASGFSD